MFVRKHQLTVGAPASFDEAYEHVTALECLLGAVGADLANGLVARARARRIAVDRVEALVHAELDDPLALVGVVGATGHPGLSVLQVRVYVSSPEDEPVIRSVWEEVLARSPLAKTLEHGVNLDVSLNVAL